MRYFIDISYKGTAYHGWQVQENAVSVQAMVNQALQTYFRQPTPCLGSGRTDTGVHALQQIAHFDAPHEVDIPQLIYKLNKLLPQDIAINSIRQVGLEAHARFDASSRSYIYKMHSKKSPFTEGLSYYYPYALDVETMNQAAKLLVGKHDFQVFSRVKTDVNTFVCTITQAEWRANNDTLAFHVSADRFLRGMVRAIVGTLLEVGQHRLSLEGFAEVIASKDRRKAGRAVPPQGLYLSEVVYPYDVYLTEK